MHRPQRRRRPAPRHVLATLTGPVTSRGRQEGSSSISSQSEPLLRATQMSENRIANWMTVGAVIADAIVAAAKAAGYDAWLAGRVRKQGGRKAVVVPPLGLTFEGDTLQVR